VGGSSSGGADALLSRVTLAERAANDDGTPTDRLKGQRLDLQLGYGFLTFGDRFTLTPEVGLGLDDSGRDYPSAGAWSDRMMGNPSPSPST